MTCLVITRNVGPHFCFFNSSNFGGIEKMGMFLFSGLGGQSCHQVFINNTDAVSKLFNWKLFKDFLSLRWFILFTIFSCVAEIISDHQKQNTRCDCKLVLERFFKDFSVLVSGENVGKASPPPHS